MFMRAFFFLLIGLSPHLGADFSLPYEKQPFDGLFVSGQPAEGQLEALAESGFTTIINLRTDGEFDDFNEAEVVAKLGMSYVHIPLKNIRAIEQDDAAALHDAIAGSEGPVLLHCTVGWRAAGLLAIERYLFHAAGRDEALEVAANAHMSHATGDVAEWLDEHD